MAVDTVETPQRDVPTVTDRLKTVAMATGVGLMVGLAAGWVARWLSAGGGRHD